MLEHRERERRTYERRLLEMEQRDLHKVVENLEVKKEYMLHKFTQPPSSLPPQPRALSTSSSGSSINTDKNAPKKPVIESYEVKGVYPKDSPSDRQS